MLNYTIRRLLQAVPLLIFISIILFTILHYMPGGPLAPYMQNPHITAADIERLKHNFGLDRPVWVQYVSWLGKYVMGDWGWSTMYSTTVREAMRRTATWRPATASRPTSKPSISTRRWRGCTS